MLLIPEPGAAAVQLETVVKAAVVKAAAQAGEMFLRFDVKPPYPDTPPDWEEQLEATFSSRY